MVLTAHSRVASPEGVSLAQPHQPRSQAPAWRDNFAGEIRHEPTTREAGAWEREKRNSNSAWRLPMTVESLLAICLVVSALTLVGLVAFAIVVLRRLPQARDYEPDSRPSQIVDDQHRIVRAIQPLIVSGAPLDSVITRLNFAESFDPVQFADASQKSALGHLNKLLEAGAGDGVTMTINSVQFLRSGAELTFSVSKQGQILLDSGRAVFAQHGASGQVLPYLIDTNTKRTIELLRGAKVAKALPRLAAISAAVVGAAHIIAGADIAKRLKLIDSNVNLLLAYRRIDQAATLERIYTSAKELVDWPMSRDNCWELWRLRGELRELRCTWRRELQHHLELIGDKKDFSWLSRTFGYEKVTDEGIHGRITEGQLQLGLIEYSMRLDQALAVVSGTVSKFEVSLAGELIELDAVAKLLQTKAGFISKNYPEQAIKLHIEPTVKGMSDLVEQYKGLLPVESGLLKSDTSIAESAT